MMKIHTAMTAGLLILAACGPDAEPETTVDWAVFDAPRAAQSEVAAPVDAGDLGSILNARRAENGLAALVASPKLAAAAQVHAQDMAAQGYFSHISPGGSKPSDRVRAQGYQFCFVAENIAQGQPTAARVMESWMASAGHRRNNLNKKATEYGVGRAAGNNWVLVLAAPC
ncbi:CAP domain-containing protein [uncultured Litoreibacter sp.]|uniref:CAP domain-containing protein n=1 Tax=uncultured Litoreibacter sp. TaxID=1392394 RepID=UPI00261ED4A8|nr:CAP domain-containing protein [uncultured Litoreibacter sp.]